MLAAVDSGDVKKLAGLIRQDPGFKVNVVVGEYERTLLLQACLQDSRSAVIPLLLAHPDIDVNLKKRNFLIRTETKTKTNIRHQTRSTFVKSRKAASANTLGIDIFADPVTR